MVLWVVVLCPPFFWWQNPCENLSAGCKDYWAAKINPKLLLTLTRWVYMHSINRLCRAAWQRSSHRVTGHQCASTDTVHSAQEVMISVYVHFLFTVSSDAKTEWAPHMVIWINSVGQCFRASYEVPSLQWVAHSFLWGTPDFSGWNWGRSSRGIFTAWCWGNLSL